MSHKTQMNFYFSWSIFFNMVVLLISLWFSVRCSSIVEFRMRDLASQNKCELEYKISIWESAIKRFIAEDLKESE